MTGAERPPSVAGKVMAILESFAPGGVRLTLTEICGRAGLPLATGHRLVRELTGGGFLERLPDGSYRIGTRLWRIGAQASAARSLRELALPHMEELYAATHENVQLAVLSGDKALYLERLRGPRSVPIVTRVAAELPLHATGVGKVLLAFAGEDFAEKVIAQGLPPYTRHTVTDADRLRACLVDIRRSGYAVTREEMSLGTCSVAAPVRGPAGEVFAALSLVTRRNVVNLRRLVPAVIAAANALARDVDAHGGSAEWKDWG